MPPEEVNDSQKNIALRRVKKLNQSFSFLRTQFYPERHLEKLMHPKREITQNKIRSRQFFYPLTSLYKESTVQPHQNQNSYVF